jgi:hypothetical protein
MLFDSILIFVSRRFYNSHMMCLLLEFLNVFLVLKRPMIKRLFEIFSVNIFELWKLIKLDGDEVLQFVADSNT